MHLFKLNSASSSYLRKWRHFRFFIWSFPWILQLLFYRRFRKGDSTYFPSISPKHDAKLQVNKPSGPIMGLFSGAGYSSSQTHIENSQPHPALICPIGKSRNVWHIGSYTRARKVRALYDPIRAHHVLLIEGWECFNLNLKSLVLAYFSH